IGLETGIELAKRGAKVILACRNEEKAQKAVEKILKATDNKNVSYRILDLASLKSVRKFADEINANEDRLDILINNAGIQAVPSMEGLTEDGLHPVLASNYFGHFLLTNLLIDLLKKSTPSRVINVASLAAILYNFSTVNELNNSGISFMVYARSKLCNIYFTRELHEKMKDTGVTTYSLHPGVIYTEFTRDFPNIIKQVFECFVKLFFKNAKQGAQTTLHCALAKDIEKYSGKYFTDCKVDSFYRGAKNLEFSKILWRRTEELVGLKKKLHDHC
ncbi:hypothetical protein GWI33_010166, partial [Rhynchophorus ferrugineus]